MRYATRSLRLIAGASLLVLAAGARAEEPAASGNTWLGDSWGSMTGLFKGAGDLLDDTACMQDPYVGRQGVEILAMVGSYVSTGSQAYEQGLAAATAALAGKSAKATTVVGMLAQVGQSLGVAGYNNISSIKRSNNQYARTIEKIQKLQDEPISDEMRRRLVEAYKWLAVANTMQLRAGIGMYHLRAMASVEENRRIIEGILGSRADYMLQGLTGYGTLIGQAGGGAADFLRNIKTGGGVYLTLADVTDLDDHRKELAALQIEETVDRLEARIIEQAEAAKTEAESEGEIVYTPSGNVAQMLIQENQLAARVGSQIGIDANSIAMTVVGTACELLGEGKDTTATSTSPGGQLDGKALVKAVQEQLTRHGYKIGTPDGLAGKKTLSAVSDYRDRYGLDDGSVINASLLSDLQRRSPSGGTTPASSPGKASPTTPGNNPMPNFKETVEDKIKDLFGNWSR